ncbi:fungal-specific transcription factor domain-containing protein [Mycena rosella]|uniref:Fungal-specific transcription factor domain-containing protein n=1 Tax=Mycena rosella TaxID=1033263 RepID=A0AAD7CUA8_MYCRO|nr:fungal-specific transcription factor domain-containing protein [Mycena rosella]
MSSNEEDYGNDFHRGKKRRIQRACDVCRRRKSRCDGSGMPGDKCSTCIDANLECTYQEGAVKRAPAKKAPSSYVETLETRLEHSEALVRQLRAELASAVFAKSAPTRPNAQRTNGATHADSASGVNGNANGEEGLLDSSKASLHIMRVALHSIMAPPPPPHADDLVHLEIARRFEKLSVEIGTTPDRRFLGKSSGATLIKAAIDLKEDVRRVERRAGSDYPTPEADELDGGDGEDSGENDDDGGPAPWRSRRLQYWQFKPWENRTPGTQAYSFPEHGLMAHLIDLYFAHVNMYIALLHRPTFERSVNEGLHLRDDGFASTLLLVCAIGSRWSDDPRVIAPAGATGRLACGWTWFDQVPLVGKHLFGEATLYDLQYYCLAVQFLEGSSAPQACWTLIGVGLRLAQDVGAHRRTSRVEKPSVENELWKRVFWVLVYMDRAVSSGMGRTCAINHDDFDLDPPIECDDEYWEHPTRPFQQPPGVPSRVAFFNALLRLNHILSFSLKILYSLTKVRVLFAVDDAWEENAVAELDSALNLWRDQVPEHLRWDPLRKDPVFFDQSVALQCHYSHLQILIHRPFIPMLRKSAPTALPSLAICTSAARTCANTVDVQRRRKGKVPVVFCLHAVFTSGIVLLLNVWSGKRTGLVPDPSREIANVHKCMEVVRLCEDRWQSAGLFWDILYELASVGQLPLPNPDTPPSAAHDDLVPVPPKLPATAPPLDRGMRIPPCHVEPMPPDVTERIHLGARGLRQTFDRPISDPQFRAPYAQPQQALFQGSFAGVVGATAGGGALGVAPMEPSAFAPAPPPDTWFPSEDPYAAGLEDPAQASRELEDMMCLIDSDTIAMWTNAPMGIEVNDWGNYFNNFSEITQGQMYGPQG